MKIQELAIIFILIILPISLVLSEYTQFQVQTLKTQTAYDSKLTAATYDAIKAFQLNATNSTESSLVNAEMRDITASVNTFRNSLMSTFKLNGYTEEELNNYIPALVYTLYDGFYIYSPYQNENHRYLNTGTGESLTDKEKKTGYVETDGNGEKLYGIKPYISYSCRYKKGNIDVVITYALDNYITVQGMIGEEYVNKSGYLIDNIEIKDTGEVLYNGIKIESETLKEYVPIADQNGDIPNDGYQYAKITGIKYYLIPNYISGTDCIVYTFNGTPIIQAKRGEEDFDTYEKWILNNQSAIQYYKDAKAFTDWFTGTGLDELEYADAYDEVISNNGAITIDKVWGADDTRKIFKDPDNMIESELSNFNQHRLAVIRHKIEINLAIAISNYNEYSGVSNVFQMPKLKEEEWEYIIHNISLISFLQGLPIGGKTYNGYSIVTNSESDKVVLEDNIYILTIDDDASGTKVYRRIGDNDIENKTTKIDAGEYATNKVTSAGRVNLDFERSKVIINGDGDMKYYYPLKSYNASYNSIVMQDKVTTYDDIYKFVNSSENNDLKTAFYTALGRERFSKYNSIAHAGIADKGGYIPNNFEIADGSTLNKGLVVLDTKGNEFVWVEVPKTTTVYPTAGLKITQFTDEEYQKIEDDLHTYTSEYRRGTLYKDEYSGDSNSTGLTSSQYSDLKKKMLKSIYKNGGFYVGRYEAGIENTYRTEASKATISEVPVIKKDAYPYNYVTNKQAQTLASTFAPPGYTSSLLFGVQYDLLLKYLETKGTSKSAIMTNSNTLGNYSDSTYTITSNTAKYWSGGVWQPTPYTHNNGDKVLLTSGASNTFGQQNIFDIGGNVYEWTLEYAPYAGQPCANRGGNFYWPGVTFQAGSRGVGTIAQSNMMAGFRVSLYKDE